LPRSAGIDPPFAKLIRGSWFAKVVVMTERSTEQIRELLDSLYRVDSGRTLATLIRLLGDFDLAEEAMHEAFAAALSLWPRSGVPGNPRPWLISTARFKAIDTLRRRARFDASQDELVRYLEAQWSSAEGSNEDPVAPAIPAASAPRTECVSLESLPWRAQCAAPAYAE